MEIHPRNNFCVPPTKAIGSLVLKKLIKHSVDSVAGKSVSRKLLESKSLIRHITSLQKEEEKTKNVQKKISHRFDGEITSFY